MIVRESLMNWSNGRVEMGEEVEKSFFVHFLADGGRGFIGPPERFLVQASVAMSRLPSAAQVHPHLLIKVLVGITGSH